MITKKSNQANYPLYARTVILEDGLTRFERLVYVWIGGFSDWVQMKQSEIAKRLGISVRYFQKAIRTLIHLGLVERQYSFFKRVKYKLVSLKKQIDIMKQPLAVSMLIGTMKEYSKKKARQWRFAGSKKFEWAHKNRKKPVISHDTNYSSHVYEVENNLNKKEQKNIIETKSVIEKHPTDGMSKFEKIKYYTELSKKTYGHS